MREAVTVTWVELVTLQIGEKRFLRVTARDARGICRRSKILLEAKTYFLPIPDAILGRN